MAKPKPAHAPHAPVASATSDVAPEWPDDPGLSAEQHSFLHASLDAACLDAAEAGWDAAIQAIELVLTAAQDGENPSSVSIDTIKLAEAQINAALAEMERVGELTDRLRVPSPSEKRH